MNCNCNINPPIDWNNLPDCPIVWDLICSGNTKGVFQLETGLGKAWAQKALPRSIQELADLIAILRPGVLESVLDGKSLTQHYVDRKHNKEPIEYLHPALEPYLKNTYSILIYQEQVMKIAVGLAGYTELESDNLRKGIGKKLPEVVQKHRETFTKGCAKVGILNEEQANQLFEWIEKGQRYLFNLSHSVEYALQGYATAYAKSHFPKEFMIACLRQAKDKPKPKDEIAELVSSTKLDNITINPPRFTDLCTNTQFHLTEGQIYFGLENVKGIGKNHLQKISEKICSNFSKEDIIKWDWNNILFHIGDESKTVVENAISCGAFDYLGLDRQRMLYEISIYRDLSKKEREWLLTQKGNLLERLRISINSYEEYNCAKPKDKKQLIHKKSTSSKRRLEKIKELVDLLENPPHPLIDSDLVNMQKEKELLGISLTVDILAGYDRSIRTCTCSEFNSGYDNNAILCAKIKRASEYTIKQGKNKGNLMCFTTLEDETGELDAVVFTDQYLKLKSQLYPDNILGFIGHRSDYKNSFVIEDVIQI